MTMIVSPRIRVVDVSGDYPPPCPFCGGQISIVYGILTHPCGRQEKAISMTHADPLCRWVDTSQSDWFFHMLLDTELRKLCAS